VPAPTLLRVRLLGGLTVEGLGEHELGSRKGRTVVKVLALERGGPVSIDRLVDALWADDVPARPADQLGVLVARLRGVLGADRVLRSDAGYRLVTDWLDLDELDQRVHEAADALAAGRVGAARAAALAALTVARGELLAGDDAPWVVAGRSAFGALIARAHHLAADAAARNGDHAAAATSAEAALALDPYDETALRSLMRAHVALGRPASALAAYVRVRERIGDDLGVDTSPETEALHDAIVLGEGGDAATPRSIAAPGSRVGFVGRQAQLRMLDDVADDVRRTGQAALLLVHGEAGMGKTALVDTWCERVRPGDTVLRGRCDELGRDLPLQPIADAISAHLRSVGEADARALLADDAPIVADIVGHAGADTSATTIPDPAAGTARLYGALLAIVERIRGAGTVVLAIDDLHLAGLSTLSWLAFATRRGRGVLALATSRDRHDDLSATHVELPPLRREDAEALIGPGHRARVEDLLARSGGNPMLLLALADADDLTDTLDAGPPASVRDAVRRQVAGLGAAARTIEAAAVLGTDVDLDLIGEVLQRPAVAVLGDLERAVQAGLLDERAGGLAFRHELVRTALEHLAGSARRALVHREAARVLDARPIEDPLAVAVHAHLGGDAPRATAAYERAAALAYARFDTDAALDHLDAAIKLGGSAGVFILRARVRMAIQVFDDAATDATEALARDGGAAALEIAGWVAYYRRRYDDARAYADRGVALAADDDALRTSCLAIAGRVRHGAGDLDGAVERLEQSNGAPPGVQGVVDVWLAQVQVHQGRPDVALRTLERPLVDADRLAHPWAGLHGRFTRALALGYLGRAADALQVCDDLDAAIERSGPVGLRLHGPAGNLRGWLLRSLGQLEAADDANVAVLERTSGPGGGPASDSVSEYFYVALLDLADGCLLWGDVDGAKRYADRLAAVDTWSGTMAWHQRHRLGLLRARLALAAGDKDAACEQATTVVLDAQARGTRRYELLGRGWLALADHGDVEAAGPIVAALPSVAALESWRLTALLADLHDVADWRRDSERQALAIAAAAGPHAERFRAYARAALDQR
jgi:DNA-binding SARP family transcriptional activator